MIAPGEVDLPPATGRRRRADDRPEAAIAALVRAELAGGRASAVALWLGDWSRCRLEAGWQAAPSGVETPLAPFARFDLASLTKPFVATAALALTLRGALVPTVRLGDVWAGVHPELARCTLERLLRHHAGLAAWTPLWARAADRREALRLLLAGGVDGDLVGARRPTYSDLGYLLAGALLEAVSGRTLWSLVRDEVARPLGLGGLAAPGRRTPIASRLDGSREGELARVQGIEVSVAPPPAPGQVQDRNARFWLAADGDRSAAGIAGHAGLFGSARDVAGLLAEWLCPVTVLEPEMVRRALLGSRPLGWAPARVRGSAGPAISARGFGHLGSTGGSAWADPNGGRIYVALAARTSWADDLRPFRRRLHRLAERLIA